MEDTNKLNLDEHVGKNYFRIEISGSCSPTLEATGPNSLSSEELEQKLSNKILQAINDCFKENGCDFQWTLRPLEVSIAKEELIDGPNFLVRRFQEFLNELEQTRSEIPPFDASFKNHPDNGKEGWWIVDGVRHYAYVKASSAAEAYKKAIESGEVGDWEAGEPSFIGEKLPHVLSI